MCFSVDSLVFVFIGHPFRFLFFMVHLFHSWFVFISLFYHQCFHLWYCYCWLLISFWNVLISFWVNSNVLIWLLYNILGWAVAFFNSNALIWLLNSNVPIYVLICDIVIHGHLYFSDLAYLFDSILMFLFGCTCLHLS